MPHLFLNFGQKLAKVFLVVRKTKRKKTAAKHLTVDENSSLVLLVINRGAARRTKCFPLMGMRTAKSSCENEKAFSPSRHFLCGILNNCKSFWALSEKESQISRRKRVKGSRNGRSKQEMSSVYLFESLTAVTFDESDKPRSNSILKLISSESISRIKLLSGFFCLFRLCFRPSSMIQDYGQTE